MSRLLIIIVAIFVLVGIYLGITGKPKPVQPQKYSGPIEKLTVGKQVEYGTLFVVAKEQGYFAENGLDVTIKEYDSGAPAFADLLKGTIDMTDAADFVGVRNSFAGEDYKILGSIGTSTIAWEIVARGDHGIAKISDLRGKKIGVTRKTIGEFFLGNFLILNQLSSKDVQLVDLKPQAMKDALLNGSIDALIIFEPHVFELKQRLGTRAVSWPGQTGRTNYIMLYATGNIVRNRPQTVNRFVHSLVQAQEFLDNNKGALTNVMRNHFHYSDQYIASVISKFKFYVSLEQPMILLMEDEARWAMDSKLVNNTKMPNYLNFIYFDALDEARPQAITIIR